MVLTLMAGLLVATPSWGAACSLIAGTPYKSGSSTVKSSYGRQGCTGTVTVYGKLKHQKNLSPDSVLASGSFTGVNDTKTLSAACLSNAGAKYYTETTSSTGAKSTSSTKQACQ